MARHRRKRPSRPRWRPRFARQITAGDYTHPPKVCRDCGCPQGIHQPDSVHDDITWCRYCRGACRPEKVA